MRFLNPVSAFLLCLGVAGGGSWIPEELEGAGTVNAYALESTDSALYAGIYPAVQGKGIARLQAGRWSLLGGPFLESQAEISPPRASG